MAVTSPTPITALPTPPSTASPANFDAAGDAFLGALPTFRSEANALATNVYGNATDAAASAASASTYAGNAAAQVSLAAGQAANAAASATQSASYAGAAAWVSGTSYAINDVRFSPITMAIYRRLTNGAGTTDPSLDAANWRIAISQNPVGALLTTQQYFGAL